MSKSTNILVLVNHSAKRFVIGASTITMLLFSGCGRSEADKTNRATQVATQTVSASRHYVTSETCKTCHEKYFDSWHETFHRTMTQDPTPDSIQGAFDGKEIQVSGYPCTPFRDSDQFFMTLVHPGWNQQKVQAGQDPRTEAQPPMTTYAVDRVIGSHHQQVYLSRGPDGAYHTLPLVWSMTDDRWITRGGSFLSDGSVSLYHKTKTWNNGCIFCHNTGPEPRLRQGSSPQGMIYTWESHVAELGIACEACHGPGSAHVDYERAAENNSLPSEPRESLIVSPTKLTQEQSVLMCARCHGKMVAKQEFDRQCLVEGDFFASGDWDYAERYDHPMPDPDATYREGKEGRYFWSNGTPRTTALEYQGLLQSACFAGGELTCLSCHSMHDSDPTDQLHFGDSKDLPIADQNRACTQCHGELESESALAEHTHHPPASLGSLCYNCHMPYQAYSLLKRTRSHRITNPTATSTLESGIPNACNQCHVDKPLDWTHQSLATWKGSQRPEALSRSAASSTVLHALSGHALQRALAVEQLGAEETFEHSGIGWRSGVLLEILQDEYAANRMLAYRALKKMPGFEDFEFDYIAPAELREPQVSDARRRWNAVRTQSDENKLREMLGSAEDAEIEGRIQHRIRMRDHAAIDVLE